MWTVAPKSRMNLSQMVGLASFRMLADTEKNIGDSKYTLNSHVINMINVLHCRRRRY